MDAEHGTISVIIPTYRRPALLRRTIGTVARQTYRDVRICVYDNCSGDDTADVVGELMATDPRIRYHAHATNIGPTANFEYGLQHVETPYFAFLSDDDILLPACYDAAMRGFGEHPEAAFCATQVVNEDEGGRLVGNVCGARRGLHTPPAGLIDALRDGIPIWTGTVWRREVRGLIGGLRDDAGGAQDSDFQIRAVARCAYVVRPEVGAIFSSRSVRLAEGVRPFHFYWPNQFATVDTLRNDVALPPDVRERAADILEDGLSRYLAVEAVKYLYWGRVDDAVRCLELLRTKPRTAPRAALLAALIAVARIRPVTAALRAVIDFRQRRARRPAASAALRRELERLGWTDSGSATDRAPA